MERNLVSFPITDFERIKEQLLNWSVRYNSCCFLDNHHYGLSPHTYECLVAAGTRRSLRVNAGEAGAFKKLREFAAEQNDWLFGHFAYELAAETDMAVSPQEFSSHPDWLGFPDLFFFIPEILIELKPGSIRIGSFQKDHAAILEQILSTSVCDDLVPAIPSTVPLFPPALSLAPRFSREEYLDTVLHLQEHILRGDCYEINFCQEFFDGPVRIDPVKTYLSLSRASPNPFAACYKVGNSWLLCASPERYLKRTGNELLSQPIKGTSPRLHAESGEDSAERDKLYYSAKDRSENVMIVDLVRNDLSRVCLPGSVIVEELYGVYTFPQVHQMISTVKGQLMPGTHWVDIIQSTFPMGSMTGAPKKRVMELIGQYERSRRGLFSGTVGYIAPGGDFDFNVVIRSILYNQENGYLSYQVGSGITFYSDPEDEYQECLLKAEGIKKALGI